MTDIAFRGWTNGWERLRVAPAPKRPIFGWVSSPADALIEDMERRNGVDWSKGTCPANVGLGKLIAEG